MIYRCQTCDETFREPDTIKWEEHSEYFGRPVSEILVRDICPYCKSEDITEVNECVSCTEPTESAESVFCKECHKELSEYLKAIQDVFNIDYEQLQEFIAEHFGW